MVLLTESSGNAEIFLPVCVSSVKFSISVSCLIKKHTLDLLKMQRKDA